MQRSGILYHYHRPNEKTARFNLAVGTTRLKSRSRSNLARTFGIALLALSLGGITGPLTPALRLESGFAIKGAATAINKTADPAPVLPAAVPIIFNPLVTEDGSSISPINTDFSIIVPKIGINAAIAENVNPANADEYLEKLKLGVAHANTSFTPDNGGTTYLFSHSTSYDWFVKDLNAVFYLLKNLSQDDLVVVFYKGVRYTYRITDKRIVSPKDVSYLVPQTGKKSLILQTCWPPGSTTERLLLFADLVEEFVEST